MNSRVMLAGAAAFTTLIVAACSTGPSTPTDAPQTSHVVPLCQLGCVDQDPNPSAPGVFLGNSITSDFCTSGTDTDQDGLSDFCEYNLSIAFAPELKYWSGDETGREPKTAAKWAAGDTVMLAYMLSYYRDAGSNTFVCSLPFAPSSCNGHNGDSEIIYLSVYYNWTTHHWVLNSAGYSQHDGVLGYLRGGSAYPTALEYPSHPGAYPRAWVSEGKHANYNTKAACEDGGSFNIDTCADNDISARVAAGAYNNIGSRDVHTSGQDCWLSQDPSNPYYGSGRLECYWTDVVFRGWIPDYIGGDSSDPYEPKLAAVGF